MDEIININDLLLRLEAHSHAELHLHHTWKPDHTIFKGRPDGLYWQQAMRRYHMDERGWSDIGQHVTLLPDGRFVTGRDFARDPASIQGYNRNAFAVEMIGNFDNGQDPFSGPQKSSALQLASWFHRRDRYIRFHNENAAKSCPGTAIDKQVFIQEMTGTENGGALMLRLGSRGEEVRILQENLNKLGYTVGLADGIFGPRTEAGVIAFQQENGLKADGIVGSQTSQRLAQALIDHNAPDNGQDLPITEAISRLNERINGLSNKLNDLAGEVTKVKEELERLGDL